MKSFFVFFLVLLSLLSLMQCAPLEQRMEVDPELTAGFFEGDIVMDKEKNGIRAESKRWPNNTVFFKINPGFFDAKHIAYIHLGMQIIQNASCIRFVEASESTKNYVSITGYDGGCYSSVGFTKRSQDYNLEVYPLDQGCFRIGTIVHEFLHTLGFYHMQSASNRDDYVRIVKENIIPNTIGNFNKYSNKTVDDFGEEYDYGSVLHYPAYAFSKNGGITIEPLQNAREMLKLMGQRNGMTKSDINKLNSMYKCMREV